jgi:CDP-diacylglycerol--serine O-phosphatidyltransferase
LPNQLKQEIPNIVTLSNMAFGIAGIFFVFQGEAVSASYCIFFALLADFLDGFVARLLKVASPLGAQLDSLADVVSFGVLPGFIVFQALQEMGASQALGLTAFAIPLLSAYRLAKFNIDTRQQHGFIGLPTPANAAFFAAIPFVAHSDSALSIFFDSPMILAILSVVFSLLLISPIPLLALKFKSFSIRLNLPRYLLLMGGLALFLIFGIKAIPLIVVFYILISLIFVKMAE